MTTSGGGSGCNMSFSLSWPGAVPGSAQNAGPIALPFEQQSHLMNLENLIEEIGGGPAGESNPVSDISPYVKIVDEWVPYNGLSGAEVVLEPGRAYLIRLKAGSSTIFFTPRTN